MRYIVLNPLKSLQVILLAFFSVVIFSIHSVFILDILVLFCISLSLIRNGFFKLLKYKSRVYLFAYIIWVVFDVAIVCITREYEFNTRNIIQILFDIHYLFFLIDLDFDVDSYVKWVINITTLYSCVVLYEFIVTGTYRHIGNLYSIYREWGEAMFPGGSTDAPIPFIFALFFAFYTKKNIVMKILISIGGLLFPSRVSLFGILIIWIWYLWKKMIIPLRMLSVILLIVIGMSVSGDMVKSVMPSLAMRIETTQDRADITREVFYYFDFHPILGFGGNTLNQIHPYYPSRTNAEALWSHTHNLFYEPLIRYGAIGMMLFSCFWASYYLSIKTNELRFLFILMLMMGMFQIYFRSFFFLFLIYVISKYDRTNRKSSIDMKMGRKYDDFMNGLE